MTHNDKKHTPFTFHPFAIESLLAILYGLFVLWIAVSIVFFALRVIPGDAISTALAQSGSSQADIASQRHSLGLDESWLIQYQRYLFDLIKGDFGTSLVSYQPVTTAILARLGPTLALGFAAFGVAISVGGILGIINSFDNPRWLYQLTNGMIALSQAVPFYVTALIVIYIFSLKLDILPAFGSQTPLHLVLPASTLGFHTGGSIAHVLSLNLRDTYRQPFMLTARAKGLPLLDQLDHALRVAILPTLSVLALQAGFLLSGTVIIEVMFVRRGLGSLLYQSVLDRDYPIVQALAIFSAIIYLLTNAASNLARRLLDPRMLSDLSNNR